MCAGTTLARKQSIEIKKCNFASKMLSSFIGNFWRVGEKLVQHLREPHPGVYLRTYIHDWGNFSKVQYHTQSWERSFVMKMTAESIQRKEKTVDKKCTRSHKTGALSGFRQIAFVSVFLHRNCAQVHLFLCSLTLTSNQPITGRHPNAFQGVNLPSFFLYPSGPSVVAEHAFKRCVLPADRILPFRTAV